MCIHDYLFNFIAPAFEDVAEHDIELAWLGCRSLENELGARDIYGDVRNWNKEHL